MDGPGISAASDLKLLFSTSTHFRGHLAKFAQNKDMVILIEAMCNAAQARLGQTASPPATTQAVNVDLYSARFADHLNYQDPNTGLVHPSDPAWAFMNGPSADNTLEYSGSFDGFHATLHGNKESPTSEYELGPFK
jgi:hypothetical protein